ncbi:hypothetical protein P152DRAFT_454838 [Eremomyces bilateralis CBS 781.70]|uniref:Uncharacterized protein n=1 Tax=Eremomyces bilateralis CBS 781.70 TaxID=1392243 RepID=A0A6G1GEX7_9PEZI|nr:uncharacterized protein P152DRAFT_454838 [Eremomyces bilateralis CBS 781.70]KAF1816603.1 hypothetical protein P152DRAFT_454838 [Eremomyces bilateralis CBS 781.70]
MRLLQRSDTGTFSLKKFSEDDPIPPYAILSHTVHGMPITRRRLLSRASKMTPARRSLDMKRSGSPETRRDIISSSQPLRLDLSGESVTANSPIL